MTLTESIINVDDFQLKVQRKGNGIPCLIIGPGLYLSTLPEALFNHVEFFAVDYYWTTDANIPSEKSKALTLEILIEDIDKIRQALSLDKILVFGPSAVGLVAMKYGHQYPEHTYGVIAIGTPPSVVNLGEKGKQFMDANFNPDSATGSTLKTDWSLSRWQLHQETTKQYQHVANDMTQAPINRYLAELRRDAYKYYIDPTKTDEEIYRRWRNFNITTRERFFEIMGQFDDAFLKNNYICPTIIINGAHDGIAPCFLASDFFANNDKITCYSDPLAAHMPQLESPDFFEKVVVKWLNQLTTKKVLASQFQ